MPSEPDRISLFFKELKRRKVVRMITVYAAAAFVILQLVSIIVDPLNLPEWTLTLVIVLLSTGFIIVIILSWIYDVTPDGIVQTKPAQKEKQAVRAKGSGAWKLASYISFAVIAGLILLHLIPGKNRSGEIPILDKSIAVLPFINDSQDNENAYIINGTMEAILDHLSKIEDLRVISRTSVEQYRNQPKSIPRIAEEMNVSYILEGSGQKYGDHIRLTLQLLDARNDKHLWSSPFQREIKSEDIFALQSEVAQLVASEITAIITPEEKQRIEKIPTTSQTAYDLYLKGLEEYRKYSFDKRGAIDRAEDLFRYALDYDSAFSHAYIALAQTFFSKNAGEIAISEDLGDTILALTDLALSYDDQLAEAYVLRAQYYLYTNQNELANKELDKAIRYNPNHWKAYYRKSNYYLFIDPVSSFEYLYKAESLVKEPGELLRIYKSLAFNYQTFGFNQQSDFYTEKALRLGGDSVAYYTTLAWNETDYGHSQKALENAEKAYAKDSGNVYLLNLLGINHLMLGQFPEAMEFYNDLLHILDQVDDEQWWFSFNIGYAYLMNGKQEEADYYFNKCSEYYSAKYKMERLGNSSFEDHLAMVGLHVLRGEKGKAYEILRRFNQLKIIPLYMITSIKSDPVFSSIRNEAEFQQIVRDVEARYLAEQERIRKWLEENDR